MIQVIGRWLRFSVVVGSVLAGVSLQAQPQGGFGGQNTQRSSTSRNSDYPSSTDIGQARITYDAETRSIIIVADDDTATHIKDVVGQLDRPAPQVLIKVVFVEVTYTKGSDIGVTGDYTKAFGPNNIYTGIVNQAFSALPGLSGLANVGGTYQILGDDFQATIRALAAAGKLEVLSRPSILARNNQQATITIGQQVPLITGVTYDNFGNQRNAIEYQDVGIILQVTPFITSDGMVEMVLAPQISSVADSTVNVSTGTNSVAAPLINIRSADTVVVTPDRQTIIIGGLMANRKVEAVTKIPFFGDIPGLGALFRRKVTNNEKTELLIFLTPTIVRDPRELAMMATSEKDKTQLVPKAFPEQELDRYLDKLPPAGNTSPPPKSLK